MYRHYAEIIILHLGNRKWQQNKTMFLHINEVEMLRLYKYSSKNNGRNTRKAM